MATQTKTKKTAASQKAAKSEQTDFDKKILFVASEAVPFIKTGGLADVAGALPKALVDKGVDCRVILPLYMDIKQELRDNMKFVGNLYTNLSWCYQYCGLFTAVYEGVTYYFIDNEFYFKRSGLYGYYDDGERFAFFSKAVLECIKLMDGFTPDIIHANGISGRILQGRRQIQVYQNGLHYSQYRISGKIQRIYGGRRARAA